MCRNLAYIPAILRRWSSGRREVTARTHWVTGEKGEPVCASPFPAMPVRFWNDPDGERYRAGNPFRADQGADGSGIADLAIDHEIGPTLGEAANVN